jgi:tripartite-type tricarboxylate transporter receptor subunit TctC
MKLPRRQFLQLAAGAAALPAVSRAARADTYPNRPVHIVLGFPPGQSADISARLLGQWLSDRLGQPFVIDNKPGASSSVATEFVVRASPDGYTLLWIATSNYINATLYKKLPYNFIRDIEPVASNTRTPLVMEVNPSVPVKTVPEFIAYAKAHAGKLNMASGGIGNSTHMAGELFKMMTGVNLLHVPYRGSAPAINDLLGGQVQVMFDLMASSIGHIRAGKLRALGVTTATRSAALPDVPTIGEFVPGYEASAVGGIGVPKGTAAAIVDKLNAEINAALTDPKMKSRFADLGVSPVPGSRLAGRLRQAHRRGNRQVGQGDQVRGHQAAGMNRLLRRGRRRSRTSGAAYHTTACGARPDQGTAFRPVRPRGRNPAVAARASTANRTPTCNGQA